MNYKKLQPDQLREVYQRDLLRRKAQAEARKHSVRQIAKDFGVSRSTIENYVNGGLNP